MPAAEPIRDKKDLKQFTQYYFKKGQLRNYLLIMAGVHTALRISDLLSLQWQDVYDFDRGKFRSHVRLTEKKTGKLKVIALNMNLIKALKLYFPYKRGVFIFVSNRKNAAPISRVQAHRIIKAASAAVKASVSISCHSLRKTFGFFAYKAGVLPVMLMDIFNHSDFETTKRYLGIAQADRDKVYLSMSLF